MKPLGSIRVSPEDWAGAASIRTMRQCPAERKRLPMGLTFIEGTARGPTGKRRKVRFLVDSGANYSLLPLRVWKALGLEAKRALEFSLADGTLIRRSVSECHITLAGVDGHTPVILGEPGDEPLLGAVTLEILGLVLDPFKRTLQAMDMRLTFAAKGGRVSGRGRSRGKG